MLIAVFSDTHDNLATLSKAFSRVKESGAEAILHCGDICKGETLEKIADEFSGSVYAVFGNMEISREDIAETAHKRDNVKVMGEVGEVSLGGQFIAFCHFPEVARRLAKSGKYDAVFYGHTHTPWKEIVKTNNQDGKKECLLVNPGTLAGMFAKATFAFYNTVDQRLELVII